MAFRPPFVTLRPASQFPSSYSWRALRLCERSLVHYSNHQNDGGKHSAVPVVFASLSILLLEFPLLSPGTQRKIESRSSFVRYLSASARPLSFPPAILGELCAFAREVSSPHFLSPTREEREEAYGAAAFFFATFAPLREAPSPGPGQARRA